MRVRYLGHTQIRQDTLISATQDLAGLSLRPRIDSSSYRGKPEQATCAFLSRVAVTFTFMVEIPPENAVKLADYGTVRSINYAYKSVWIVILSLESINTLASELSEARQDDYLDCIRAIILILDMLDFNRLLDYEKDQVSPTFIMKRKR